jgi:hypothetical protein
MLKKGLKVGMAGSVLLLVADKSSNLSKGDINVRTSLLLFLLRFNCAVGIGGGGGGIYVLLKLRPNSWTKSGQNLQSFRPCYSQSPLQLCHEISINSNSHNLLQFLQFVTVHCKGERRKHDKNHTPFPRV